MNRQEWIRIFQNHVRSQIEFDTWEMRFDDNIEQPNRDWKNYIKRTSGRFRCSSCRRSWPSNRVMVIFHMRLIESRGTVKVRPMRQNCKICTDGPMEEPEVESDNIEVLMENLMKKIKIKCYHEEDPSNEKSSSGFEVKSPHEPEHCEGCQLGICSF